MGKFKEFLSKKKKFAPFLILIIGLLTIGGAYFFINRDRFSSDIEPSPTPTVEASPTDGSEDDEEPSPTEDPDVTGTLTPTESPTPTEEPTATPTPEPTTQTFDSTSGLDGFRSNNGGGNDSIEIRVANGSFVGSDPYELVTRGFVSFDISDLPDEANIQSANLRLYQYNTQGTPYSGGNSIVIDHLDYGSGLDSSDYDTAAISSGFSAFAANNSGTEYKDADVTSAVEHDLSEGHSRSQYRLRFNTEEDGDGDTDAAYFYSANPGSNDNPPQLVVTYTE